MGESQNWVSSRKKKPDLIGVEAYELFLTAEISWIDSGVSLSQSRRKSERNYKIAFL